MTVLVRTEGDPTRVQPRIREFVAGLDANLPLHRVQCLEDLVASLVAPQKFRMQLIGAFSLLTLVLAFIGTYGVASYAVNRRAGELGVRMALGATGAEITRLVVRDGLAIASSGILIGLLVILLVSRALSGLVFGIAVLDPVTLALVSLLLLAVIIGATVIPPYRATRVDPASSLRAERDPDATATIFICCYSDRSATWGSTRPARRAGSHAARNAAESNTAGTATNVRGSIALMPKSSPCCRRASRNAAARPSPARGSAAPPGNSPYRRAPSPPSPAPGARIPRAPSPPSWSGAT